MKKYLPIVFKPQELKHYWRKLICNDLSLLRLLQYDYIERQDFNGKILDYGGGKKSHYQNEIKLKWCSGCQIESININPDIIPNILIKPDQKIPRDEDYFNFVISLNTFEHIYNIHLVLAEIYRVLKNKGSLLFTVPFSFRIHGSPNDYSRYTPAYWNKILTQTGYSIKEIMVLQWGPFSNGLIASGIPGPLKKIRLISYFFLDSIYWKTRRNHIKKKSLIKTIVILTILWVILFMFKKYDFLIPIQKGLVMPCLLVLALQRN